MDASRKLKCVCDEIHLFKDCPYLIESKRPQGWQANKETQAKIDSKLAKNSRLKKQVEYKIRKAAGTQSSEHGEAQQGPTTSHSAFASLSAFSVDRDSDPTRFKLERTANKDEKLVAGKTVYQIEAFGSVDITVQSPSGPRLVTLLDVALAPGFSTNTASLHRFTSKGVHWDTQYNRLHIYGKAFCAIQRVGSHWALEHTPVQSPSTPLSSFAFVGR